MVSMYLCIYVCTYLCGYLINYLSMYIYLLERLFNCLCIYSTCLFNFLHAYGYGVYVSIYSMYLKGRYSIYLITYL